MSEVKSILLNINGTDDRLPIILNLPAAKPIMAIQFRLLVGNIMNMGFEKAFALQTDLNLPTSEILAAYVYKMGDYSFLTTVVLFYSYINIIDFIATIQYYYH